MTASIMSGAAILAAAQQPARPAQPARDAARLDQQAMPTGSGTITGIVTMATGQPARKVRVNLSGAELRGNRTTVTDDQGRFSFTALPAGGFNLSATKPGHLSVTYGQRRPGTQGTLIQLSEGQKFEAHLQIPRGGVLTGVIVDENGEVTPGTPVRALRYVVRNGQRTPQSSGSGTTDDRGIYRIYGLQPGEYTVCATPRNTVSQLDRVQAEMQALRRNLEALAASQASEEQTRAIQNRLAAAQGMMPQLQEETPSGYAPICYPGTTAPTQASTIALGVGEERAGIDFQLQVVPMARIEGMVVNSTGAEVRTIQVMLQNPSLGTLPLGTSNSARADAEGKFRFPSVPPGQYRITARAQVAEAGAGRGRGPTQQWVGEQAARGRGGPDRPQPITLWASADIVVDGRNLSNVMLPLQQGMSVSGQLRFDGSIPPPADLTRLRVTVVSADPGPMSSNTSARVDANGRFTVTSVAPGRYRVSAGGAQGWFVESVDVGGQDALDFPFEIKGNQNVSGVTVTFTDKQTELTGIVVDDRNQPAVDYTLVIFPSDQRYWTGSSRRVQTVRPGTNGRFTVRNLPPGEYKLATVLDIEPGAASDPAFLQQIDSATMRITLQPGEKKQQDIRLR